MSHATFNIAEAARYLYLTEPALERLVRGGGIPFTRAGPRLVFRKSELDAWASRRIFEFDGRQLRDYHGDSRRGARAAVGASPLVTPLLAREQVDAELPAKTRASVLREMVRLADRTGRLIYPEDLLASLEAREALCSTALPGGLALLHPCHYDEHMFDGSFLALARTVQPVPFNAPDGGLTDIFFLLCCADDRLHLHLLSRICMMCMKTPLIERLRLAPDAGGMAAALAASENAVAENGAK